ncbi:MAG: 50S ribosomal protein L10 [Thermoprotei archaeon]|nr:MAG: 50S ribosomal protein L10 [Thermoprotei archaeon]RLF00484.1 MAG: 50S ribosomal protein L10 [Thermoprotei archaeon]
MSVQAAKYVRERPIPPRKIKIVEEMSQLFTKYPTVAVVSIRNVGAPVLHEIRALLKEKGDVLRVCKNTLARIAIDRVKDKRPGLEKLKNYLKGENAFIFSKLNPFELYLFLEKNKIPREARPGDIAPDDIVIPSGNTGFAPGPILSLFGKLKIPTRIQEGSIWITKDTVVAKKGDMISAELAELLKKLDIKPILSGLEIKVAITDGVLIEKLELNLDEYREQITEAHRRAIQLSIGAPLFVSEALPLIIQKAAREANSLLLNAVLPLKDSIEAALRKAENIARVIYEKVKPKVEQEK